MARRLSAVMFTYIAGYTALTKADEAAALRLQEEQEKLARPLPDAHRGRKIKSTRDGLLLEIDSWERLSTDLWERKVDFPASKIDLRGPFEGGVFGRPDPIGEPSSLPPAAGRPPRRTF